jgi:polysaccharide biosynthesis protein PslG
MTGLVARRASGMRRAALQALLLAACGAAALQAPGAHAGEKLILGVQTHFGYGRAESHARLIDWLKAAKVGSTRDEMFWNITEDDSGAYGIRQGAQVLRDAWWNELPAVAPLLTLGFGHPRYDGAGQPQSPRAVAAYAAYARWLVSETRGQVRRVEVWNEWNLKAGAVPLRGAQGGAADYVRLAKAATQAVKAVDPGVQVLVGGVGDDYPDWRWMREALTLGLLDGPDGVSVHLYNHCKRAEAGADEMLRRIERLQTLLADHAGKEVPIYLTEVGWPTHEGACGQSEADAGVFTLRLLLEASLRPWLKGVWVYESIDSGSDPTNQEHRFGLLRRDGSERPSGAVVREHGALIASRPVQVVRNGSLTAALYQAEGRSVVFAWGRESDRGARRLRVSATTSRSAAPPAGAGASTRLDLRAPLEGARPAVFVLPQTLTLEGVQLE